MNVDEILKFDMSLEHISSIAIAVSLWEEEEVKEMITKDGFYGGDSFYYDPNLPNELNDEQKEKQRLSSGQKVVNYIFEQLDLMNIPDHLLRNIKTLVVRIGQKIFYWRKHLSEALKLDEKYAEKIFFTSYGQIDELRILQECWLVENNFPKMEHCKCFIGAGNSVYCLASVYGLESFVKERLHYMKNRIFPYLANKYQKEEWSPYVMIVTWIYFCKVGCKSPAVKAFIDHKRKGDFFPASDILMKCVSKGNVYGAKYFWDKLEQNDKVKVVTAAAEESLRFRYIYTSYKDYETYYIRYKFGTTVAKEMAIRLVLFFIGQMTEIEKSDFINYNFVEIFKLFFQIWPYQELCEKFLYQLWDRVKTYKQKEILDLIFNNLMSKDEGSSPDYFTMKSTYETILKNLMNISSKEVKVKFMSSENYVVLHNLYKIFNIDVLSLIINDVDLTDYRNEMVNIGNEYFKKMLLTRDYESINKFVKNTKMSGEEIGSFKKNVNLFYKIVILDEFLKFCSMTPDEIVVMKTEIASNINWWIDTYGLEKVHHFEMLEALLRWVYGNNEDERKRVIKNYINSSHGSLLCVKIVENYKKKLPSVVLKFFNTWIEPPLDFEALKMHLEQCDCEDARCTWNSTVSRIKYWVEKRKADTLLEEHYL